MKSKKLRILLASAVLFISASTLSPSAFADNYGIVYQGGEVPSEYNVTIDPDLIVSYTGKSTKKSSAFSLSPFFGEILGAFIVAIVLGLVAKMINK